jgi:proline iminopeptidase
MTTMTAGFVSQGKDGILKARAVEDRLMRDTWELETYDLKPKSRGVKVPTLIIAGDSDFIPPEVADNIARAIPKATLMTMRNCGHFAYLECADDVRKALSSFFRASR